MQPFSCLQAVSLSCLATPFSRLHPIYGTNFVHLTHDHVLGPTTSYSLIALLHSALASCILHRFY